MSHESPLSVADAVYRALENGSKLPPLTDSDEVREALLSFELQKSHPASLESDHDNGNGGNSCHDDTHGQDQVGDNSDIRRGKSSSPGKEKHKEQDRGSIVDAKSKTKKIAAYSVLMLEALSRRRMDAVRQLHEVCPQLLASIPLFDRPGQKSFQTQPTTSQAPCTQPYSHRKAPSVDSSASTTVLFTAHHCPLQRSSRLLDLAAENRALLVFVLEHHPDVGSQQLSELKTNKNEAAERGKKSLEDIADEPKLDTEEEDFLADFDPSSPITICIRKNNPEVLQYLLFKHVWQHFLLDEIFKLPQNSLDQEELVLKCPDCRWFLPCSALMGCSYLLDLLLRGKFCNHSGLVGTVRSKQCMLRDIQRTSEDADAEAAPEVSLPPKNPEESGSVDHENSPSISRLSFPEADHMIVHSEPPEQENVFVPIISLESENVQRSSESPTNAFVQNAPGELMNMSPHSEVCSYERAVCSSEESDDLSVPCNSASPVGQRASLLGSESPDLKTQILGLTISDPNMQIAVSLPVMDRWISRCMHLKMSPLHLACWRCDPASMKVLLCHNADVTLMAEELDTPKVERGEGNVDSGGSRVASTPSSESSLEMALNYVSVTVNSSSFDLTASYNSLEDRLKKRSAQGNTSGLSPLALLALGIRSPPDFSLSIGKSLGLVLPTLPELWGGQVDRSCPQAKVCLMKALQLLLEAGCDVNQSSVVFGKTFRVMELFLQPSIDLYYAPLMPRGGRDSAVLRCMDLERVADLVLSACWELCSRGAVLGPNFCVAMEWNLFRMDWMFLQNESLQKRFLHLAIYLGLFPPLDPYTLGGGSLNLSLSKIPAELLANRLTSAVAEGSQRDAGPSGGAVDVTQRHLPSYTPPPRPSCIPWAPSTSRTATPPSNGSSTGSEQGLALEPAAKLQPREVVTSYYSTAATPGTSSEAGSSRAGHVQGVLLTHSPTLQAEQGSTSTASTQVRSADGSLGDLPNDSGRSRVETSGSTAAAAIVSSPEYKALMRAQMALWALEERQRRCLEKFVNDVIRLSVPQSSLALILRFMSRSDLRTLANITQRMIEASSVSSETALSRLNDAVRQAQCRSLRHDCKLVILVAARWRFWAVQCLPLPESLKRYLVDPHC